LVLAPASSQPPKLDLMRLHPANRNVQAKIRQQLQVLRDLGHLDFLGNGSYRFKDY
jgi:hypothetical protein